MKFINYRVFAFSLTLALGILFARFHDFYPFSIFWLLLSFVALLVIWIRCHHQIKPSIWFSFVTFTTFFGLGYAHVLMLMPSNDRQHFIHFSSEEEETLFALNIRTPPKRNTYHTQFEAEVISANNQKCRGRLLLNINGLEENTSLKADNILWLYGRPETLKEPLNPGSFNYKEFLINKGIHYEIKTDSSQLIYIAPGRPSLLGSALRFQHFLMDQLQRTTIGSKEKAIIQGLILGNRSDIDPDQYNRYSRAGAVHILAVSGLHVGILLMMLQIFFKPLERLPFGRFIKVILLLIMLWSFAFIAGLSPSVVRAVAMFSLFSLASLSNRPTNPLNTLAVSFLLLLTWNPLWLFHIGFQFSYAAVFSILWIQPKIADLYRPNFWILKKGWDIITVSLAAQLGVAPLSIYYFHQFPGLFLVSNLVIIPFLGVLLMMGILVVVLAAFEILPEPLAFFYDRMISGLNSFVDWIAAKQSFVVDYIALTQTEVMLLYACLTSLILFKHTRTPRWTLTILGCLVFFQGYSLWYGFQWTSKLIIFQSYQQSVFGYESKSEILYWTSPNNSNPKTVEAYGASAGKKPQRVSEIPKVLKIKESLCIIIDSVGVYPNQKGAYVILTHSPKIHLGILIDRIQPKVIIADGSNYPSYAKRWKETCNNRNIPFHDTHENGAFIYTEKEASKNSL